MKRFVLTLAERGSLHSFEVRAHIEVEADSLLELLAKFIPELARVYQLKIEDTIVRERIGKRDDDVPF